MSGWSDMADEDDLQGASRVVGGTLRGNALGNIPNMADYEHIPDLQTQQVKGKVLLYVGEDNMPLSMNHTVGSNLSSVLHGLATMYSPIKKTNSCVCVQEDGTWAMKGRFSNAVKLHEPLPWSQNDNGTISVSLKTDLQTKETPLTSGVEKNALLPSALPADESTSLEGQIIALLDIPQSLTIHSRSVDLRVAYAKYLGALKALSDKCSMIADGTWTLGKVNNQTVIEIFIGKTAWHGTYSKVFAEANDHPFLVKWLKDEKDAPSSRDIFGVVKPSYTFADLKVVLNNLNKSSKKEKKRSRDADDDTGGSQKKHKKKKHSYARSEGSSP